ncbi:MAG: DUF1819 family protein [Anaerolineales bacterium]|nr:DUF1819 family protein [Anaerolineales bacterium]
MIAKEYKTSFTTGSLFFREAITVTELYFKLGGWSLVRNNMLENNLLQARTQSSFKRTLQELLQRLQCLTKDQLQILVDGSRQEQNQILWLAVCKHYRIIYEFAIEVIREKFLRLDLTISYLDYDVFFNSKAEWHEGLDQLTNATKKKLRQVLFRILHEAEIISSSNSILPAIVSARVAISIVNDNPAYLAIFPITDAEIQKQAKL